MKKLLIALMLSAIALCGCGNNDFEEIEEIDIEVSDYVEGEETPTPSISATPSPQPTDELESTPTPIATPSTTPKSTPSTATPAVSATPKAQTPTPVATPVEKQPVKEDIIDLSKVDLNGKIICIDAAHGIFTENKTENLAPISSKVKNGYTEGTKGAKYTEDKITLEVAKKVQTLLSNAGVTVLMTRTDENAGMTNVERAKYANENKADLVIKLHADGTIEGGTGMTMIIPTSKYIKDTILIENSRKLANNILTQTAKLTKSANRGVYQSSQMSGLNWAETPAVIFEMGFITNPKDEEKLANSEYQDKIAQGIYNGIAQYFSK